MNQIGNNELIIKAISLRLSGNSINEIAKMLSVYPKDVKKWLKSASQSSNLKKLRLDSVRIPELQADEDKSILLNENERTFTRRQRPTIKQVSDLAGVSISTVSNYINQSGRMSDETRKRIREVMDSLNFTPSGLMKGLREGRTGIIGVYIYSLESLHLNTGGGITARLLSGINSAGGQTGNNLLLYTGWEADYRKTPWEQFLNGHIDGLIWVDPFPGESTLSRLANAGLPVVAIFTHHVPDQIGYVNSDNTGGIVLAIEHLHSLGHRRIAYIGRSDTSNYMDRLIGYRQGLSSVGLPYDPSLEITGSDESWAADNTLIAVDTLLKVTNSPTAFVLPDDRSALRVVTHLENQNISVPDDVSVIGFDDIPDAENKILGGLTTIRQEFLEIGDNAVKLLMKLINGASVDDCRINVPTTLVVRNSTGKCKN